MSDFQRYAVYYLPDDDKLAAFGASWLGWDVACGRVCPQPPVEGIVAATQSPRKYGFHGTLKPPFRLSAGTGQDELDDAVAKLAERCEAVLLDGLRLARIARFLALVPTGFTTLLNRLAFKCVADLDVYRAPPGKAELERRRAAGLTPRQDALLCQWGYPYVAEEFRFHLTLTGPLEGRDFDRLADEAGLRLPALPEPFQIGSIALVGEGEDGLFRLIHRYALTG